MAGLISEGQNGAQLFDTTHPLPWDGGYATDLGLTRMDIAISDQSSRWGYTGLGRDGLYPYGGFNPATYPDSGLADDIPIVVKNVDLRWGGVSQVGNLELGGRVERHPATSIDFTQVHAVDAAGVIGYGPGALVGTFSAGVLSIRLGDGSGFVDLPPIPDGLYPASPYYVTSNGLVTVTSQAISSPHTEITWDYSEWIPKPLYENTAGLVSFTLWQYTTATGWVTAGSSTRSTAGSNQVTNDGDVFGFGMLEDAYYNGWTGTVFQAGDDIMVAARAIGVKPNGEAGVLSTTGLSIFSLTSGDSGSVLTLAFDGGPLGSPSLCYGSVGHVWVLAGSYWVQWDRTTGVTVTMANTATFIDGVEQKIVLTGSYDFALRVPGWVTPSGDLVLPAPLMGETQPPPYQPGQTDPYDPFPIDSWAGHWLVRLSTTRGAFAVGFQLGSTYYFYEDPTNPGGSVYDESPADYRDGRRLFLMPVMSCPVPDGMLYGAWVRADYMRANNGRYLWPSYPNTTNSVWVVVLVTETEIAGVPVTNPPLVLWQSSSATPAAIMLDAAGKLRVMGGGQSPEMASYLASIAPPPDPEPDPAPEGG